MSQFASGWWIKVFSLRMVLVASLVLPASLLAAPTQAEKSCAQPTPTADQKYIPGQVWSFKSRSFEPNATVTILSVEMLPKIGEVIHVRFDGIRLRNCSGGPEPNMVEHAPFTRDAIERSGLQLIKTGSVPAYMDGYAEWLSHCGGVYKITAAEMVVVDEQTRNSGSGCTP